jgi:hypothetical protein
MTFKHAASMYFSMKLKKYAATTVGYARKQEKKEWFDEECATVNK